MAEREHVSAPGAWSPRPDAPHFGTLAWLRRTSGDDRLPAWRLSPERLEAYLDAIRLLAHGGVAVELEDAGAVLDQTRQPLLRPWEYPSDWPGSGDPGPAQALADLIDGRPNLAAALRACVDVEEFAAAHLKLAVCARSLVLLTGEDASRVLVRARDWVAMQRPHSEAERDFVASLLTAAEGSAAVEAAFNV